MTNACFHIIFTFITFEDFFFIEVFKQSSSSSSYVFGCAMHMFICTLYINHPASNNHMIICYSALAYAYTTTFSQYLTPIPYPNTLPPPPITVPATPTILGISAAYGYTSVTIYWKVYLMLLYIHICYIIYYLYDVVYCYARACEIQRMTHVVYLRVAVRVNIV